MLTDIFAALSFSRSNSDGKRNRVSTLCFQNVLFLLVYTCTVLHVRSCNPITHSDDFTVTADTTLDEIPCVVTGNLRIQDLSPGMTFNGITQLGALTVMCTNIKNLPAFPDLTEITGMPTYEIDRNCDGEMEAVQDAGILIWGNDLLESFEVPQVSNVQGNIRIQNNPLLESINVKKLHNVDESLWFSNNIVLLPENAIFPKLVSIGEGLFLRENGRRPNPNNTLGYDIFNTWSRFNFPMMERVEEITLWHDRIAEKACPAGLVTPWDGMTALNDRRRAWLTVCRCADEQGNVDYDMTLNSGASAADCVSCDSLDPCNSNDAMRCLATRPVCESAPTASTSSTGSPTHSATIDENTVLSKGKGTSPSFIKWMFALVIGGMMRYV